MIRIEKGIPLPETKGGGQTKYGFHLLDVGDSFFVEREQNLLSSAMNYFRKKNPDKKFTARKEGTGTRVWRVE